MTDFELIEKLEKQLRETYVLLGHVEAMTDGDTVLKTIAGHRLRIAALLTVASHRRSAGR